MISFQRIRMKKKSIIQNEPLNQTLQNYILDPEKLAGIIFEFLLKYMGSQT